MQSENSSQRLLAGNRREETPNKDVELIINLRSLDISMYVHTRYITIDIIFGIFGIFINLIIFFILLLYRYRDSGDGIISQLLIEKTVLNYLQQPKESFLILSRNLNVHIASAHLLQYDRNRQSDNSKQIVGIPTVILTMQEEVTTGKKRVIEIKV